MRIKEVTWKSRFDYCADMVCEGCEHEQVDKNGYDDTNYHQNVIPEMKCKSCGKTRNELTAEQMTAV